MFNLKCEVYKQSFESSTSININCLDNDYQKMKCLECDGSGLFYITNEDFQKCNECKGCGEIWFNLF